MKINDSLCGCFNWVCLVVWSRAAAHANTFIAIPNDRTRCLLCARVGLRRVTLCVSTGTEKGASNFHVFSKGSLGLPSIRLLQLFIALLSESGWKHLLLRLFPNTKAGIGGRASCLTLRHPVTLWLSAEPARKGEADGRGRAGEMFKCLTQNALFRAPVHRHSRTRELAPLR